MVSSTQASRAIPHEELLPTLQRYCFSEGVAGTLQREPGFDDLRYRAHQIRFVAHFAREITGQELSIGQLARAFGHYPTHVKDALANEFEEPKRHDRHMAFDDDSEGEILTWIEAEAEKSRPVTLTELRHYCEPKYSRFDSKKWMDSSIISHRACLTEKESTRQQEARLEVPRVFLVETIRCLREYVQGMKAELVFNLEEIGPSEWEDRKDKKVIVSITMEGQTIHHRASRNVKHISIITCISAGG
jgi:AraC-like DNA-binding protein